MELHRPAYGKTPRLIKRSHLVPKDKSKSSVFWCGLIRYLEEFYFQNRTFLRIYRQMVLQEPGLEHRLSEVC